MSRFESFCNPANINTIKDAAHLKAVLWVHACISVNLLCWRMNLFREKASVEQRWLSLYKQSTRKKQIAPPWIAGYTTKKQELKGHLMMLKGPVEWECHT